MNKFPSEHIGLSKGFIKLLAEYVYECTSSIETSQLAQSNKMDTINKDLSKTTDYIDNIVENLVRVSNLVFTLRTRLKLCSIAIIVLFLYSVFVSIVLF